MSEPLRELDDATFSSVLCVVAHPDDIEYGTSAAVAGWTKAGKPVRYWLATRGEAGIDTMHPSEARGIRETEQIEAGRRVGVDTVEFGEYADGVVEYTLGLRRDITRVIRRHRPDLVVTGDYHDRFAGGMLNQADHRNLGLACVDAVAAAGNRWIFPELADEGLLPWHVPLLALAGPEHATHFVDVSATFTDGVGSLEAHQSYNDALPGEFPKPASLLERILGEAGQMAGVRHALLLEVFDRR